jgi:hypothetical protein
VFLGTSVFCGVTGTLFVILNLIMTGFDGIVVDYCSIVVIDTSPPNVVVCFSLI